MKKLRKSLAVLLALVMMFSLCIGSFADDAASVKTVSAVAGDLTGKTVILHTNDMHGAVEAYAKIAALKAEYEAAGAEVILADAGDFIQGTTYVSVSQGKTAVQLMNAVGYDVATLGNHEFDYGYENLTTILADAAFKVTSNIQYKGESVFPGSCIFETAAGLKVGVFGLTTPETATKAHPAKIQGVTFAAGNDLYAYAQTVADQLKNTDGCDLVICLSHLGVDPESEPSRSYDVLANVKGVDFVIDGHSHSVMTSGDNGEAIQSTGTKGAYVGVVVLDDKGVCDNYLFDLSAYEKADESVKTIADGIIAEIESIYGAKFATTEVLLDGNRAPGVRTQETNLGDLITDAILWQATKDGGLAVPNENVIAITNGGGIRATIQAGDVTMNDINTVLPFGNTVAIVYVSGAELLEVLEASTYCTPDAVGAFPQTAGIKYTLDVTVPYDQGEQYTGSTYYGPASINRISIQSVNGKAFDETATYAVVTNDFLAAGGDTYYAFTVAENVMDTGVPMDEAVMAYITEVLDGTITAEKYGKSRGDLTIIREPFSDVWEGLWYYDYIVELYRAGIVKGMTETTFEPDSALTWGQALKLLLVGTGTMEDAGTTGYDWAAPYVEKAVELGLVESAVASEPISRLDFCTVAAKLIGLDPVTNITFTDCEDGYVGALADAGVINGFEEADGSFTFRGDEGLTRAQITKIISLLLDQVKAE